jgi:hypothetical protein
MIAMIASLLLATPSHMTVSAEVVRWTSFSVTHAERASGTGIQITTGGSLAKGEVVVESSRDIDVRFRGNNSLETRGSGTVRLTLYPDGAPPAGRSQTVQQPSSARGATQVEAAVRRDVQVLPDGTRLVSSAY